MKNKVQVLPANQFTIEEFFKKQDARCSLKKVYEKEVINEDTTCFDSQTIAKPIAASKIKIQLTQTDTRNFDHAKKLIKKEINKEFQSQNADANITYRELPLKSKFADTKIQSEITTHKAVLNKKVKEFEQEKSNSNKKNNVQLLPQKKLSEEKYFVQKKKTTAAVVPYNQKVEEILNKKDMRERFSSLLLNQDKLTIGYDQRRLIKTLNMLDNTFDFLTSNRAQKIVFFDDLRKNISDSLRYLLTMQELKQLLFIDSELFEVSWAKNQKIHRYDLLMKKQKIGSADQRQKGARKRIICYLKAQEAEYVAKNKITKADEFAWAEGFDPNVYEIPKIKLPAHPYSKSSELGEMSSSTIENIKNQNLKSIIKTAKKQVEQQSRSAVQVADMMWKSKGNEFKQKLYAQIRQKQKRIQDELAINQKQTSRIDKQDLVNICDEIVLIYMHRNISSMFKICLIEQLDKKLQFQQKEIIEFIQILLQITTVDFMKETTTSSKSAVIQVNKTKLNEVSAYIRKTY